VNPECSIINLATTDLGMKDFLIESHDKISYFNLDIQNTANDFINFAIAARKTIFCSIMVADLRSNDTLINDYQIKINSILVMVKTDVLVLILNEPILSKNIATFTSKVVVFTGLIKF